MNIIVNPIAAKIQFLTSVRISIEIMARGGDVNFSGVVVVVVTA